MKKAVWWVLAGLIVVGCGGEGSGLTGGSTSGTTSGTTSGSTSGSTSGGTGRAIPDSKLGNVATMQFLYLSGQGRRAVDSKIAQITFAQLQNSSADFVPREQQGSGNGIRVQLDGYTLNSLTFEERLDLNTTAARGFAQYPLSVSQIDQTTTTGNSTLWRGNFTVSPPLAVNARLFPGRQTTLQMKLNDAILDTQTVGGVTSPTFNRTQFESENYDPVDNRINGFLSDHVAFDLRQMAAADRPSMSGGTPAERILFSGDAIALASGADTNGSFEVLPATADVTTRFRGIFRLPTQIAGRAVPGTYVVTEPDPRVPSDPNANTLTALQGIWRAHTDVLDYSRTPQFAMVAIPNHDDKFPTPDAEDGMQVVIYNLSGSNVVAMWQGRIRFTNTTTGLVECWSVNQIANATPNNPAIGTISNFELKNGRVVAGDFNFTVAPGTFPFPRTGGFRVLR